MKKYSYILIIINLLLLLGYFNWSVYQKEQTLKSGKLIFFRLAPVDPRSLMQGDYMSLRYEEPSSDLLIEATAPNRGYAILATDSNSVGKVIRLQESIQPLSGDEIAIKYNLSVGANLFGSDAFFFEEGQASIYEHAVYGGYKVDSNGESSLVGLYDEKFRLLEPDKL